MIYDLTHPDSGYMKVRNAKTGMEIKNCLSVDTDTGDIRRLKTKGFFSKMMGIKLIEVDEKNRPIVIEQNIPFVLEIKSRNEA